MKAIVIILLFVLMNTDAVSQNSDFVRDTIQVGRDAIAIDLPRNSEVYVSEYQEIQTKQLGAAVILLDKQKGLEQEFIQMLDVSSRSCATVDVSQDELKLVIYQETFDNGGKYLILKYPDRYQLAIIFNQHRIRLDCNTVNLKNANVIKRIYKSIIPIRRNSLGRHRMVSPKHKTKLKIGLQ